MLLYPDTRTKLKTLGVPEDVLLHIEGDGSPSKPGCETAACMAMAVRTPLQEIMEMAALMVVMARANIRFFTSKKHSE